MKKIITALLFFSLSVSSCTLFPSDKDEYKTPELFLSHIAIERMHFESSKEGYDYSTPDYDKSVYYALKNIHEYEEISTMDNPSETYFLYEEIIPATSGPNIARMTIYENGYLEIYRKESLGKGYFFYYSFDAELAFDLNRLIEEKISFAIDEEKRAKDYANAIISMDNFFIDAKKQTSVLSSCSGESYIYDFYATIDVVNLMENITYELEDDRSSFGTCFRYNSSFSSRDGFNWSYHLSRSYDKVELWYYSSDALNREYTASLIYRLDSQKGRMMYENILSIAKATNINGL